MHQVRREDIDLMSYEQSHKVGRKIKPVRKKKKTEDIEDLPSASTCRIHAASQDFLPLEDRRIGACNIPLGNPPRWDFTTQYVDQSDAVSTIENRLRSPTGSG